MMSNKKNTSPAKQENVTADEKKKLDATRIFLIVFAAVALLGILASVIVAIVIGINKNKTFDYMKANLSRYVTVSSDVYKNYDVTIDIPEVGDRELNDAIIKVLAKNKITPDGLMLNRPNITLSAGDVANIYYRGYTLDENDKKNYFDGGCNFGSTIASLEIGSGSFIPGFEYNLIGKNQKDYAEFSKLTSGKIQPGDIIKLTYSVYYSDGVAKMAQTATIDLSDPDLDEKWGEGFSAYFNDTVAKKEIGTQFGTSAKGDELVVKSIKESTDANPTDRYFDMTISEAYRISEGERLVVEAYFPHDYSEKTLRSKTAYFEVYIKTAQDYETPELGEQFITETLKLSADDLSSYEGDDLVAKYKNYLMVGLRETYDGQVRSAAEDALWEKVLAEANFKKLPESEVDSYYQASIDEINATYASGYYSSTYGTVDAFARAYLGLNSNADWKAVVRTSAEESIKQKLAFYYIVREENYVPSDAEYQKIYDEIFGEHLDTYLEYYGITEESEDYETKLEEAKNAVKNQFASSYWDELVLYEYAIEKMVANANIIKK